MKTEKEKKKELFRHLYKIRLNYESIKFEYDQADNKEEVAHLAPVLNDLANYIANLKKELGIYE